MKNVKMETAKGVRDFLPKEKILREYIISVMKEVFEEFGFNPLETPAIELLSVMTAKGGNEPGTDAYEELYKFKDRAGREIGLKFEQTFALARVVAMNPQLLKPFKRYQIDRAWRDGPTKTGRYKEFWQADIDTVGSFSILADAEIVAVLSRVFEKLNMETMIKISDRKLLNGILEYVGIPENKRMELILIIDKLDKFGREIVITEAKEKEISEDLIVKVLDILDQKGSNQEKISSLEKFALNKEAREGIKEIREVIDYAEDLGAKNIIFVPTLARGLTYYTGPIFEVYLKSGKFKSSLAGGGRWDNMINKFMGCDEIVPATGVAFGLDTIYDAIIVENIIKQKQTIVKVFAISIKTEKQTLKIVSELRKAGISADVDLLNRKLSKNLEYVNSQGIPYVVIIGEKEIAKNKILLRDMTSGKEELLNLKDLIKRLK